MYLCTIMLHLSKERDIIAFSTERGFVDMDAPYDGFNITWYTDDNEEHIANCRHDLCQMLEIDDQHLVLPRQIHDTLVAEVTTENIGSRFEGIDALITTLPRTCIGVSTADCVPILLYDARTRAIAAAHAGWRGTVAHIAQKTIAQMAEHYGSRPEDLKVAIGPSIGPEAFEIGDEVYEAFAEAYFDMQRIALRREKWHIDLWTANALDIQQTGVPASNIEIAGVCTYEHYDQFFSARRLGIKSGRIYTGIMIK